MQLRERFKIKKLKKKLTNVSFAFTHTYTPVKTNIFRFFPQAYMKNFEKCAKTQKQKNNMLSHVTCGNTGRGVWVLTAPCDQNTTPYGSKPLL